MPSRITLIYHAYKNFEVPNKIAKMIQDGTIQWRSHHDDIYYTDEDGKEQRVSSSSEFVAWEGHDDYEVEEAEESDEESECCGCQQFGDDGCRCDCHSKESEEEEESEEELEEESEESLVEGVDYEVLKEEKSDTK
jgi:hypothetical protein